MNLTYTETSTVLIALRNWQLQSESSNPGKIYQLITEQHLQAVRHLSAEELESLIESVNFDGAYRQCIRELSTIKAALQLWRYTDKTDRIVEIHGFDHLDGHEPLSADQLHDLYQSFAQSPREQVSTRIIERIKQRLSDNGLTFSGRTQKARLHAIASTIHERIELVDIPEEFTEEIQAELADTFFKESDKHSFTPDLTQWELMSCDCSPE